MATAAARQELPIDAVRQRVADAASRGRVVLAAPTGSGKSTRLPVACRGRVLVVEPRRIACMSLAERVAEENSVRLGGEVGYWVRDDRRAAEATRVLYATPGIVLRARHLLDDSDVVILDEFHERGLETDLLLALLRDTRQRGLLVMSATLQAQRVAHALGAEAIRVDARSFPVEVRYSPGGTLLPTPARLAERVAEALHTLRDRPGDVLVFLPGKAEIARVRERLEEQTDLQLVSLHGGLSLRDQRRAFAPNARRKVVLATNVAETSVTVPGVATVIDSGLLRCTRYHHGRSYLTLSPIADDSAEQRAGRAGRTAPGLCIRLWDRTARLQPLTPPAIHRESLSALVLAAAAVGADARTLPFLDAPKAHALDDAHAELQALEALDADGRITALGRELFGLPLDPSLGRLLLEARRSGTLDDIIDLVAALSLGRPLWSGAAAAEDLRDCGCDATAAIKAVRLGEPRAHGLSAAALAEARATAARLRASLEHPETGDPARGIDRAALATSVLRVDPRAAHVARVRKKAAAFSNGGTEISLSRDSALQRAERLPEAIAVLGVHAVEDARAGRQLFCTAAIPLSLSELGRAGLGRPQVGAVQRKGDRVVATVERVFAKRVLVREEQVPEGPLAREAIAQLFTRGALFPNALARTQQRMEALELARRLSARGALPPELEAIPEPPESLRAWVDARLLRLGVESGRDVALLSEEDLTLEPLPDALQQVLDQRYPLRLALGDATYRAEYDLEKHRVTLHLIKGRRAAPPPLSFLPRFSGLSIVAEAGGRMHRVR